MLGQNNKDNHRIRFELVVDQINITCSDSWKITDHINIIALQLNFVGHPGKEEIRTEGVTKITRTSPHQLDYTLTWKHPPLLQFSGNLSRRKGLLYEKEKKPPELYLIRKSEGGAIHKLGSAKLELHELANKKGTGQPYEKDDKISINLRNNKKLMSCEILVKYRIPDTDPSVILEYDISPSITPSISTETVNSDRPPVLHLLKNPLHKMLSQVLLIGKDGNIYSAEWAKMHLIFVIFGTIPDFMRNLKVLVQMLRDDRRIGIYIEVIHICQGKLQVDDVMWPYLPQNDPKNAVFHTIFNIPKPHSEHPNIYVVNKRMTEYFVVKDYQIERYIEERNVVALYEMWNNPTKDCPRSISLNDNFNRQPKHYKSPSKSSSCGLINITQHNRSSSYDGSSLNYSSSPSSVKGGKITESNEYKELELELFSAKSMITELQASFTRVQEELDAERNNRDNYIHSKLKTLMVMETESQAMLEKCQKENIFFRHQVILRGNLGFRSGPFNIFKSRWFQLERLNAHTINPLITFYSGPDKLGEIMLNEITSCDALTETQFRLSTRFANYVLCAEHNEELKKWLSGIQTLQHTFGLEQQPLELVG